MDQRKQIEKSSKTVPICGKSESFNIDKLKEEQGIKTLYSLTLSKIDDVIFCSKVLKVNLEVDKYENIDNAINNSELKILSFVIDDSIIFYFREKTTADTFLAGIQVGINSMHNFEELARVLDRQK